MKNAANQVTIMILQITYAYRYNQREFKIVKNYIKINVLYVKIVITYQIIYVANQDTIIIMVHVKILIYNQEIILWNLVTSGVKFQINFKTVNYVKALILLMVDVVNNKCSITIKIQTVFKVI